MVEERGRGNSSGAPPVLDEDLWQPRVDLVLDEHGGRAAPRRLRDEAVPVLRHAADGAKQGARGQVSGVRTDPGNVGKSRRSADELTARPQGLDDRGQPAHGAGRVPNSVTVVPAAAESPAAGQVWCVTPKPLRTTRNPRRCSARTASRSGSPVTSGTARRAAGTARALSGGSGHGSTAGAPASSSAGRGGPAGDARATGAASLRLARSSATCRAASACCSIARVTGAAVWAAK